MNDNQFNDFKESLSKAFNDSYESVKNLVATNTKKLKIKAEIGQNERDITKAYTRLGEAFYTSVSTDTPMGDVEDVLSLIDSKKKLNDLLNEKLEALRESDSSETNE